MQLYTGTPLRFIITLYLLVFYNQLTYGQEDDQLYQSTSKDSVKAYNKQHPILNDRVHFELGLYIPSKNLRLGADGSVPGQEIDFRETFDFNDSEVTLFSQFEWYFTKKWKLSVENFNIKNGDIVQLEEDIEWEGIVFKEGTYARGGFEINVFRIYFGRVISSGLKHQLGLGLGVHALNTSAFIEGQVDSTEGELILTKKRVSALIPLPNIGFWYYYTPHPKWALIARLDWFSLTINEYSGGLTDLAPGVKYQIFDNFGVGFTYRYFFVNAKVNNEDWSGKLDLGFSGPVLSIHANF